jgi:hypothetical protein
VVSLLYFDQFHPFHCSSLPLPSHFPLNICPYILYLHRYFILRYCWHSIIPLSFPSSPELHSVVPSLQTCSRYMFVYDSVCFCVYVYLLDLFSIHERKHVAFIFLSLAYFT